MTACTQAGCTGQLLDGYCDVCGAPEAGGATGVAAGTPEAAGAATAGPLGCHQPGCTGLIVDGYCDVCGAPSARDQPDAELGTDPDEPLGGAASTLSRASSQIESAPLGSARAGQGSVVTRRVGSRSSRLRGSRLGAGLTRVPPIAPIDPATAVLQNPEVAENKRFCPNCGEPVGRSRNAKPGRTEGFCTKCRNPFSFAPKLAAGDLVGGQYRVAGCLAHGGLGWIYLAQDRNVSDRWVVLKGLLNSGDADAQAAAIAEQQFLARVEHPLIVEIYNFVTHQGAGYIVMEYVGGTSLKDLLKQRMKKAGHFDPLPVDQAIAYLVEILPAFQYLHDLGLVYCDFKPDNLIQVGDALKLIDLGGVRRQDDTESAIYGTVGYQAPEVAEVGPSIAGDIYTVGRTLLVLAMEFRGYQSRHLHSLPPVDSTPLFSDHDSLYRLLVKACAPAPADRFVSADELRVQLLGVLREVMAQKPDSRAWSYSVSSPLFASPVLSSATLTWQDLPALRFDDDDPMASWIQGLPSEPWQRLAALVDPAQATAEVSLETGRTALQLNDPDAAQHATDELLTRDPWEWRAVWLSGLIALYRQDASAAQAAFNAVYGQVPGELAPKLALALACELGEQYEIAEGLYLTCARTDANYRAAAAFGIARVRTVRDDLVGAIEALDLVPSTSSAYPAARRQRAVHLLRSGGLGELDEAINSLDTLSMDPRDRTGLAADVLARALQLVESDGERWRGHSVGGLPATGAALRGGLEGAYRQLARLARSRDERIALVDRANKIRPWTMQ